MDGPFSPIVFSRKHDREGKENTKCYSICCSCRKISGPSVIRHKARHAIRVDNVPRSHEHIFHVDMARPLVCTSTSFSTHSTSCSRSNTAWAGDDRCRLCRFRRKLNCPCEISLAAALIRFVVHRSDSLWGLTRALWFFWVSAALLKLGASLVGTLSPPCPIFSRWCRIEIWATQS